MNHPTFSHIVMLTKSSKFGKYCVAGIDLYKREWVRLVSPTGESDGAISDYEMRSADGYIFKPLDVVKVATIKRDPIGCQTENQVLDTRYPWTLLGTMTLSGVLYHHPIETPNYIFEDTQKYLLEDAVKKYNHSLVFTEVTNLTVYKNELNKQKCSFTYNGYNYYDISVTDPDYYTYLECKIQKAYIVVSIPHSAYEGRFYKFVAKIFPLAKTVDPGASTTLPTQTRRY